jgi:hypothetical protein
VLLLSTATTTLVSNYVTDETWLCNPTDICNLVSDDFNSYTKTQDLIDETFKNQDEWVSKSILSVARMGFFTSGMLPFQKSLRVMTDLKSRPMHQRVCRHHLEH